jgi:cytochrome P450
VAAPVLPPGPKGRPIVGLFPEFRRDPATFLLQVSREYGDIAYFRLNAQHMFLFSRPEYVQDILITNQRKFEKSRIMKRSKILLGEGLLTSEGDFHLRQRRLAQPAFHRERLISYSAAMVECAERAQSRWRDGETLDMHTEMTRLTLTVVARTLFSVDIESSAAEIGEVMTHVVKMFDMLVLPFSELLQRLPLPAMKRFEKARDFLDKTIYGFINERRAAGVDRGDLLSMLLLAQDEQGDHTGMTDQQVRDEVLTLFLAGHETTANALTWTWYLLSRYSDVEQRMRAELDQVLGERTPTFDDIANLRYTEMVLAESMRLYPPAWALTRLTVEPHTIGGVDLPVGSIAIVCPYILHRDPRFWSEPDRFDPERWTAEAKEKRPRLAYLPFGAGARICIGERFAWMEGILLLATMGRKWRMELDPGQKVAISPQITLRPKHGMRMRLSSVHTER